MTTPSNDVDEIIKRGSVMPIYDEEGAVLAMIPLPMNVIKVSAIMELFLTAKAAKKFGTIYVTPPNGKAATKTEE